MRYAARCVKMLPKKKSKKNNKIRIMINKESGQDVESIEYGIDSEAIRQQAEANLQNGNREYRKLKQELDGLDFRRDFVKINLVKTKMKHMVNVETNRLWMLEMEKRKSVKDLSDLLLKKDRAEYEHFQELMAGLSLLLDMTDNIFFDINKLLNRNNIGIEMNNFPELKAAKKTVQDMAIKEQYGTARYKEDLWNDESERIYKYLLERCATYRRKVDRIESKMKKTENKG